MIRTTGASILLIRPYLRANHHRQHRANLVIFFIFLVSNIAGLLTPLGDPPLFLGFLRGIPFHWTLTLIPQWAFAVGAILIVFNLYDQYVFGKEEIQTAGTLLAAVPPRRPFHVEGLVNLVYLVGVIATAVLSSRFGWPPLVRDLVILTMAFLSWFTTANRIHQANHPVLPINRNFRDLSGYFRHHGSPARDLESPCRCASPDATLAIFLVDRNSFRFWIVLLHTLRLEPWRRESPEGPSTISAAC